MGLCGGAAAAQRRRNPGPLQHIHCWGTHFQLPPTMNLPSPRICVTRRGAAPRRGVGGSSAAARTGACARQCERTAQPSPRAAGAPRRPALAAGQGEPCSAVRRRCSRSARWLRSGCAARRNGRRRARPRRRTCIRLAGATQRRRHACSHAAEAVKQGQRHGTGRRSRRAAEPRPVKRRTGAGTFARRAAPETLLMRTDAREGGCARAGRAWPAGAVSRRGRSRRRLLAVNAPPSSLLARREAAERRRAASRRLPPRTRAIRLPSVRQRRPSRHSGS